MHQAAVFSGIMPGPGIVSDTGPPRVPAQTGVVGTVGMRTANGGTVSAEAEAYIIMANALSVPCDGCGQMASPEHIARRLRRLEWATRYRPVHIQTLLLGGVASREDADFLYAPGGEFRGEAADLLRAVGIAFAGKAEEAVHAEFQSAGLFLTYLLECPLEGGKRSATKGESVLAPLEMTGGLSGWTSEENVLLREHLPAVATRIRRSLKPKRVLLLAEVPQPVVQDILSLDLGCPVVLDDGKPFRLSSSTEGVSSLRFRELLSAAGRS